MAPPAPGGAGAGGGAAASVSGLRRAVTARLKTGRGSRGLSPKPRAKGPASRPATPANGVASNAGLEVRTAKAAKAQGAKPQPQPKAKAKAKARAKAKAEAEHRAEAVARRAEEAVALAEREVEEVKAQAERSVAERQAEQAARKAREGVNRAIKRAAAAKGPGAETDARLEEACGCFGNHTIFCGGPFWTHESHLSTQCQTFLF